MDIEELNSYLDSDTTVSETNETIVVKKENLWDVKDIAPVEIDITKKPVNTYAIQIYAGPGKAIPPEATVRLIGIIKFLARKGYTLRHNGGTTDLMGINLKTLQKEDPTIKIDYYLPYKAFNKDVTEPVMNRPNRIGYGIAVKYREKFNDITSNSARAMIANDGHIMFGEDGSKPNRMILVYNLNGLEEIPVKPKKEDWAGIGYTAYFLKLAAAGNINVFNFKNDISSRLKDFVAAVDTGI